MFVQSSLVGKRIKFQHDYPDSWSGLSPNCKTIHYADRTSKILAVGLQKGIFFACIEFEDKPELATIELDGPRQFDFIDWEEACLENDATGPW